MKSLDQNWDFAGWGKASRITNLKTDDIEIKPLGNPIKHQLGSWRATAICGNDISSSCLYVSAICASYAGIYAPLVLLIVAGVLYLFRKVYAEVGSALPLNGGTYTVLLNTTSKQWAAAAACLTLLSYVATAVISAGEAAHYGHSVMSFVEPHTATIGILVFFACLTLFGISESSLVALGIFLFHLLTLVILSSFSLLYFLKNPDLLSVNWQLPPSSGIFHALVFGFGAAMLGISGFESSANFIEEQKKGVFPKTLRNMWLVVLIFNPLISFLSFCVLPAESVQAAPPDLLALMGKVAAGDWLAAWISLDAVLVLSGAVLTSFVGVTGLIRRMSLDRCLPAFFLKTNKWRGTNHWIGLIFLIICCSIFIMSGGEIKTLAGVYTISFLSVMALFAVGNMLLKSSRAQLPREIKASWATAIIGFMAVVFALLMNLLMDPISLEIFIFYFLGCALVVAVMFLRTKILRLILLLSKKSSERIESLNRFIGDKTKQSLEELNASAMVYFANDDSPQLLNEAALYVLTNEQTRRLIVIHVYQNEKEIPSRLAENLKTIDKLYPQLRVDFIAVHGEFTPALIEALSRKLRVPKNFMFIATPGDHFPHRIEELGGVRLILG